MSRRRYRSVLLTGLSLVWLAGCGHSERAPKPLSTLTEAQRDSVLARSNVPGASAVGRAFEVAGKEAGHAAQMESLVH